MMKLWEAINALHQMYGVPDAKYGEVHDSFASLEHLRSYVADLELRDRINEARPVSCLVMDESNYSFFGPFSSRGLAEAWVRTKYLSWVGNGDYDLSVWELRPPKRVPCPW